MALKNTEYTYGTIAKWLHWIVAILFLSAYSAVYYRHWFTVKDTPANWNALQLHLSFGITIGAFVLLRVIWKLMNEKPKPLSDKPLEVSMAKWGHGLLYFFMILMPITGYLGTGVSTDLFFLTEVPMFKDSMVFQSLVVDGMGLTWETFEKPMDFFHKRSGEYLVWVLILVHISAALYHHFVKKDGTLKRMV